MTVFALTAGYGTLPVQGAEIPVQVTIDPSSDPEEYVVGVEGSALAAALDGQEIDVTITSFKNAGIVAGTIEDGVTNGLAIGEDSYVKNNGGLAIGDGAKAGNERTAQTDTATHATAIGTDSEATSDNSTAIGYSSKASGKNSIAIGDSIASGENNIAIGYQSELTNFHKDNTAVGTATQINADAGTAIGKGAYVSGDYGTAIGRGADSWSDSSVALGSYAKVDNNSGYAVALGAGSVASEADTVSVGVSEKDADDEHAVKTRRIVNVKDGRFEEGSTDAVTAGQLYDAGIVPGKAADGSVAIGNGSTVTSGAWDWDTNTPLPANGVAIGDNAKVNGSVVNGVAIGQGAEVRTDNATAIGQGSRVVSGDGSVALGQGSMVTAADAKGTDAHGVVSVGLTGNKVTEGFTRRIINVADGINASDAATYGQVKDVDAKIGDLDFSNTHSLKKAENVTDALTKLDTKAYNLSGKFDDFSRSGIMAGGTDAESRHAGADSIQLGNQARAAGQNSIAFGVHASVTGEETAESKNNGVAIGYSATAAGLNTTVLGATAKAQGDNATALGQGTLVTADNSVALGAGSRVTTDDIRDSDTNGVVSVGKVGGERRIINVADGVNATDAATVGQISKITGMNSEKGNVVQYDGEDKSVVTFAGANGTKLTNLADGEFKTGSTDAVTAGQLYAAGITPGDTRGNAGSVAMGGGYNNYVLGNNGTAIGYNALANENAVAIGNSAGAGHLNATAVGQNSNAMEEGATALGQQAWAEVANSTAIGYHADVELKGDNSVALGANSIVATEDILDTDAAGVVSVGSSGHAFNSTEFNRRIINVADGVNDTDAATVGQISKITGMDSEKGNVVQYDGEDKSVVTFAGENGTKLTNLADGEFKADSTDAVTAGQLYDAGFAPGTVNGENGMALGVNSVAGANSAAIGTGSSASGDGSTAIGNSSRTLLDGGTAIGNTAVVTAENGTAIGANTMVMGTNSVALGAGTRTTEDNVVAVGGRRITGAGEAVFVSGSTDAVTAGQLYAAGIVPGSIDGGATTSIAIGRNAQLIGNQAHSVAIGMNSTIDTGMTKSVGEATAIGYNSNIGSTYGTAIGSESKVDTMSSYATAVGYKSAAKGQGAVSIGSYAGTTTTGAVAIGYKAKSEGFQSVALGQESMVTKADVLSDDNKGVVSVGKSGDDGFTRRIINVADGINATDAATVGQISKITGMDSEKGNVVQYDGEDKSVVTFAGENGTKLTNVADGEFKAGSKDAVTAGQLYAAGIVPGSTFDHNGSMAIGLSSNVIGDSGTAIGVNAGAGENAVAIGNGAGAMHLNATAVGENSKAMEEGATALGKRAWAEVANSTAIGYHADVELKGDNSVALGANSIVATEDILDTDTAGVVSVGSSGHAFNSTEFNRRIINVADGVNDNDAATVGQIKTMTGVDAKLGGVVQYDDASKNSVTFQSTDKAGTTLNNVNDITMNVEKYLSGTSIVQGYKTVSFKDAGIIPGTFNGTANKDTIVLGRDSTASKDHSVVIGGGARAIASNTVSIGTGASADANNSMAIGSGSKVIGAAAVNGTAIGTGSQVTDKDGTALGYHAYAWGEAATVVGSDSRSWADGGTTLGQNARIQSGADNSVALGKNSYVSKDDILAGDTNGVVSVGVSAAATDDKGTGVSATTINRRIINVADGINDSDAATVGQIKTITGIDSAKGNVVQYDTERQDQITFGGANGTALLNISNLSAKTATIGNISFTNDGRITNVTAGVDDSDVATVGQIKNLTGLDSAQGNVVQYDKDGNLNVGVGDSSLQVNDTAASISHGDNSVSVGADGTTVTGDLNVTGDLTFNGETVSSDDLANAANVAGDVSDIKEQIGAGTDGTLGLTNEQTTLVGGINANTEAINGVKTIVGDGKLDNGAADLTAGINANSAAIEQNRQAIGALGSRVSDLGEEVDSVGAISAALAGLHPLDYNGTGSKFQISAALGTYDGTQAAAIGGFYHFNRDTLLSIGGSTSFEGDRKTAANVGVTFRVGEGASEAPAVQDNETKQQMEAMKQEIEMLKAELEQLKNKDTEGTNDKN